MCGGRRPGASSAGWPGYEREARRRGCGGTRRSPGSTRCEPKSSALDCVSDTPSPSASSAHRCVVSPSPRRATPAPPGAPWPGRTSGGAARGAVHPGRGGGQAFLVEERGAVGTVEEHRRGGRGPRRATTRPAGAPSAGSSGSVAEPGALGDGGAGQREVALGGRRARSTGRGPRRAGAAARTSRPGPVPGRPASSGPVRARAGRARTRRRRSRRARPGRWRAACGRSRAGAPAGPPRAGRRGTARPRRAASWTRWLASASMTEAGESLLGQLDGRRQHLAPAGAGRGARAAPASRRRRPGTGTLRTSPRSGMTAMPSARSAAGVGAGAGAAHGSSASGRCAGWRHHGQDVTPEPAQVRPHDRHGGAGGHRGVGGRTAARQHARARPTAASWSAAATMPRSPVRGPKGARGSAQRRGVTGRRPSAGPRRAACGRRRPRPRRCRWSR